MSNYSRVSKTNFYFDSSPCLIIGVIAVILSVSWMFQGLWVWEPGTVPYLLVYLTLFCVHLSHSHAPQFVPGVPHKHLLGWQGINGRVYLAWSIRRVWRTTCRYQVLQFSFIGTVQGGPSYNGPWLRETLSEHRGSWCGRMTSLKVSGRSWNFRWESGEGGAETLSESQAVGRALVSEHEANLSEPVPEKESWEVCIGTQ